MTNPGAKWTQRVAPVERLPAQARITYDRLAPWYDLVEAPFERQARAAGLNQLAPRPGERILEIGFGTGHTLRVLAGRVGPSGTVTGVDLSMQMARTTRRRLHRHNLPIRPALVQGDARHLPTHSNSFDAVIMSFVLDLIATYDIPTVLDECRRVLLPEGRLTVISLALSDKQRLATRLYLRAHRQWPRLIDCRPLPVQEILTDTGYAISASWAGTILGIPVVAITAESAEPHVSSSTTVA